LLQILAGRTVAKVADVKLLAQVGRSDTWTLRPFGK